MRCLRRDMGRDLVYEVCVMVPHNRVFPHPSHALGRGVWEGGLRAKI